MSGFKGLKPTVGIVRRPKSTLSLEDKVKELLTGRTIERVDYSQLQITLHLDNGAMFSMSNVEGFEETQ